MEEKGKLEESIKDNRGEDCAFEGTREKLDSTELHTLPALSHSSLKKSNVNNDHEN